MLYSLLDHIHALGLVRCLIHSLDWLLNEALRIILVIRHLDLVILCLCEILTFHHMLVLGLRRNDVEV